MRRYIELGHAITDGMSTYPGLPAPAVRAHLSHADSRSHYGGAAEFEISRIDMVGNVGTYLDSPYHRFPGAPDVAEVPLERLVDLEITIVDAPPRSGPLDVDLPRVEGRAVLVRTDWSQRWGSSRYWEPGPHLSAATIRALLDGGAALVGVDFWNVDDPNDPARPAHTRLLRAGIPIIEHLCNLADVWDAAARLWVLPLRVHGAASLPVRPVAVCSAS